MIKVSCTVGSAKNNGSCAYVVDGFIDGIGGKAEVKDILSEILTLIL